MKTAIGMLGVVALVFACVGCSSKNVVKEGTRDETVLRDKASYTVAPLVIDFKPTAEWELSDEEWDLWVKGWQLDYKKEFGHECDKDYEFIDGDAEVTCVVTEIDKSGTARANVTIKDGGTVIYEGVLEGVASNSVFEGITAEGRTKFAILNIARMVCDLMEVGHFE